MSRRQVFRVRRFHDQQATRDKYTERFLAEYLHQFERNVFDHVKCRNDRQTVVLLGT